MKQSTRISYRQRVTRVIEYIYNNLENDLSVDSLAEVAFMSPFHFHRIYRELAQETLNASIRRLRLQRAAVELIRSKQPIARIARQAAYGSQEAFSRAFTRQFGETPTEYREFKQKGKQWREEPFIAMLPAQQKEYTEMYQVEIVDFERLPLVGYQHKGDYMEIGSTFEKLFVYAASHDLLSDQTRSIGLYYDDPKSVITNQLRAIACITLSQGVALSDSDSLPESTEIPAGRCATLVFKGSYAELEKPYDWLFGHWLPQSGYEAADFPCFEEYLNDPKETPPSELLTKIHCLLA
jgi:AraC family transcriptional regulator